MTADPYQIYRQLHHGLCPHHAESARRWRDHHPDDRHPTEPGGGILMDSRPPWPDLVRRWAQLSADQIQLIADICRQHCPQVDERPAAVR